MKIPEETIQEIREASDIVDVVGQHVTLKRHGRVYKGLCPFHNEKTPSFSVDPVKKFYYCFGCQKGGSVFNFLMDVEGVTFREAAESLASKAGIVLNLQNDDSEVDDHWRSMRDLYTRVAGSFQFLLKENEMSATGREYLKKREVSQEMIDEFSLGWAPNDRFWLFNFLKKKNFTFDFLKDSKLFTERNPQSSLYWNRIIFPISSPSGQVIGFGGRAMQEGGPKYINSPDSDFFHKRKNLYGLDKAIPSIRKNGEFLLVEGYFDVIAFFQAGIPRAVAPLGTAFTEDQAKLMRRYAQKAILVFDGDSAGIRAAIKTIHICEEAGITALVAVPPDGQDPADILQKEGPEALHNLIKFTINNFDYLVEKALEQNDSESPEGKLAILRNLSPFLEKVESNVRLEGMVRKLADILEVDYRSVDTDLRRIGKRSDSGNSIAVEKKILPPSLELYLMLAVAANREQFSYVRGKLQLEDLIDPKARSLYITLEECFRSGSNEGDSTFFDRIDEEDVRQILTRKIVSGEFEVNPENVIRQSLKRVKRESLIRTRDQLERELRQIKQSEQDSSRVNQLLTDKMFIDEELTKLREL